MTKKKRKGKSSFRKVKIFGFSVIATFSLILIGVASWTFYSLLKESFSALLMTIGIQSEIIQDLIIVISIIFLLTILMGLSIRNFRKSIKKILKG